MPRSLGDIPIGPREIHGHNDRADPQPSRHGVPALMFERPSKIAGRSDSALARTGSDKQLSSRGRKNFAGFFWSFFEQRTQVLSHAFCSPGPAGRRRSRSPSQSHRKDPGPLARQCHCDESADRPFWLAKEGKNSKTNKQKKKTKKINKNKK